MIVRIPSLAVAFALVLALSGLSRTAGAQPAPKPAPAAAKLPPEIERGVYAEFDFGTLMYLGDAGGNVQPGVMAGFAIGADVGKFLKIEGRMLNATNDSTGKVYKVGGQPAPVNQANPCSDGDANAACTQAPDVQASLVTGTVKAVFGLSERLEVHGMLGGGILMSNPSPDQVFSFDAEKQIVDPASVEAGQTVIVGGGGGMQYYTRLRHFSVGTDFAVWNGNGGVMITLFPTIKYTF